MNKKKRYLITTSDEKTWKFDRPVIFLGEWCRLYSRKHVWQNMDAVVAKPYGLDLLKKDSDNSKVIELEEKLFPEFYGVLNEHFNLNYSKRFWQILLGPWFREILKILVNRIYTLKQCLEIDEISGTTLYNSEYCALAIPNLKSGYTYYFENEKWNNVLNGLILNLIDNHKFSIDYIEEENSKYLYHIIEYKNSNINYSYKQKFKNYIYKGYKKIAASFVRDKDAFLISTYFPTKELVKLELALKQLPQIWRKSELKTNTKPNKLLRKYLSKKFIKKTQSELENILRSLLFELIPVCYLEGFEELKKILNEQPWPKSPKLIFTSNNFGTDEIFKLYTAINTENGTKYFIGQHGNNYFTSRYHFPRIEEQTADRFFTWGWKGSSKYIPTFIFKTIGLSGNHNTNGGLLLVERPQEQRLYPLDTHSDFLRYFEDQINFVKNLKNEPKQKLTIRLSSSHENTKLNENSRWHDFNKDLKIDNGKISIRDLILENRLVVHSYDSTGILETLSQNIPTLAFWQDGLDHLREEVRPDYQKLIDAGIIHFSAKSVAYKVNEIWENVDGWWLQKNVQEAKKQFCNIYAKNCKNPINTMASLLVKKEI